ncbi:hypothetical protein FA15DRAFT_674570 [Coprinopsis marcescibilis]|uniref:Uncharacterized protein n=1 Tax=Coprinopsis marcescibilis TaxID=230819 RepID=A0A5C3KTY6_COPMA|nr:hypothetical protein FA15DRAFT_674570 [Coprinopsis marcescibilis]
MSTTVIVDDNDPSITWLAFHWDVNRFAGNAYGDSAHLSTILGATMSYTFTGTQISVYGIIAVEDDPHTVAAFSVDGTHHREFRAQYDPTRIQWRALLYTSPQLDGPGPHTLQVTNLRESARLWIDYFTVQQPVQPPPSNSQPPSLPPSPSQPPPAASSNSSAPELPPPQSDRPEGSSQGSNPSGAPNNNSSTGGGEPTSSVSQSSTAGDGVQNSFLPGPTVYIPQGDSGTPSNALDAKPSGVHAQAGMIAGAAVGAIAAIAIFILFVLLLLRRRRSRIPPSARFSSAAAEEYVDGNDQGAPVVSSFNTTFRAGTFSESKQALNVQGQSSPSVMDSSDSGVTDNDRGFHHRPPSYVSRAGY